MIYIIFSLLAMVIYFLATLNIKKDVKKLVTNPNQIQTKKEVIFYNKNPLLPTVSDVKSNVNKFF